MNLAKYLMGDSASLNLKYSSKSMFDLKIKNSACFRPTTEKALSISKSSLRLMRMKHFEKHRFDRKKLVCALDEISNHLCCVGDVIECIRNVHPFDKVRNEAADCLSHLLSYVNSLNCDKNLYEMLKSSVLSETDSSNNLDPENVETERNFNILLYDLEIGGSHLDAKSLKNLRELQIKQNKLEQQILIYSKKADIRITKVFDQLFTVKSQIAEIIGFPNFAELKLKNSMAGSVDRVQEFLQILEEFSMREIVSNKGLMQKYASEVSGQYIFSFNRVLEVLEEISSSVFGIKFIPHCGNDLPIDAWEGIKQLTVVKKDDEKQVLGSICIDLMLDTSRPHNCHFTLRGRRIRQNPYFVQLPKVMLHYNIPVRSLDQESLINHHSVKTIFHEFGHALHSILYTGMYQNLSGTRCPTDVAEIPSNLLECFACDPVFLGRMLHSAFSDLTSQVYIPSEFFNVNIIETLQHCYQSLLDLEIHCAKTPIDCYKIMAQLNSNHPQLSEMVSDPKILYQSSFSSYGSQFYSYLWAEAHAKLIYRHFIENGRDENSFGSLVTKNLFNVGNIYTGQQIVHGILGETPSLSKLVQSLVMMPEIN